jgi:hypothetical protein
MKRYQARTITLQENVTPREELKVSLLTEEAV